MKRRSSLSLAILVWAANAVYQSMSHFPILSYGTGILILQSIGDKRLKSLYHTRKPMEDTKIMVNANKNAKESK